MNTTLPSIVLPKEYGYVMLVGAASAIVAQWHGLNVGSYRGAAKISYPQLYATHEEAKSDPAKMRFNCAQRAHGNFIENYPSFLVLLAMGGIKYPTLSAAGGLIWLAGRIVYTLGYCTGNPRLRARGNFQYIGQLTLLGTTIAGALQVAGLI